MISAIRADLGEQVRFESTDEHAALDAVSVGLQDGGDSGAAVVVADVVGDDVGQRHDRPVQMAVGSWMQAASRSACRYR